MEDFTRDPVPRLEKGDRGVNKRNNYHVNYC